MKTKHYVFTLLFLVIPITIFSQAEAIFNGITLDESLESVKEKIEPISKESRVISIDHPTFPLAKDNETHLVCASVKTENGTIERVVFTFADDKLSYIEAQGNTIVTLSGKRKDTANTYMDYQVYEKDLLFINSAKDKAWIINPEASHANLFTWENPYLDSEYKTPSKSNISTNIPAFLKMGATLVELQPILESQSKFTLTEELDGSDPNAQLQINCFGVDYLGFPRKIEARFGNGKLNVVWILTAKGEEDRIRQALVMQFGEPIFANNDWEIYDDWQVGLRKDKPEVLLMTKELGYEYKTSYFKQ